MKPFRMIAAATLLAACSTATPPPAPQSATTGAPVLLAPSASPTAGLRRTDTGGGSSLLELRVERFWTEDGVAFATVRVRNTATYDLAKITVECTAIDADAAPRTAQELLLAPSEAPLPPGMERAARVSFGRCEAVESMTCEARAL